MANAILKRAVGRPSTRSQDDAALSPPPIAKARRLAMPVPAQATKMPSSILERAAAAFRTGGWQGKLPCRENEQGSISSHLQTAVKQGGSMQVLYVSGMPGTGKTASVLHIVDQMRQNKTIPHFTFVHVNSMRLGTPVDVFNNIFQQLRKKGSGSCAASRAHTELTGFFSERHDSDPVVVMLIDEIDYLVTRNQAVLYRVFDWLALPEPRLAVVAISNTMDLPERLLPRVASRFGIVRVDFQPYQRNQIVQILTERLQAHSAGSVFSKSAMTLCAARVAAGEGDIRKALQLCLRATEVCLAEKESNSQGAAEAGVGGCSATVTMKHLEVAEKDLLQHSPAAAAIARVGKKARLFLLALLLELRQSVGSDAMGALGNDAVALKHVIARYAKLLVAATSDGLGTATLIEARPLPTVQGEADHLVGRLESISLLVVQKGAARAPPTLALGCGLDQEDLARALLAIEDHEGLRELIESGRV